MRYLLIVATALLAFGATRNSVAADTNSKSYDITCRYDKTEHHPFLFRFAGHYTVNEDGTAKLSDFKGVLLEDVDLSFMKLYESKAKETVENDAGYNPRPKGKYADHVRFALTPVNDDDFGGESPSELIIARKPAKVDQKPFDNGVNKGIELTYTFHAGVEYHFSDQDGNRAEVTCTALDYEIQH